MSAATLLAPLKARRIRPGLERIRALLRALGSPHRYLPAVLIAGTNGKGSTASALESILRSAGYRTGLFTSPRLSRLEDQILVAGQPLALDDLIRHILSADARHRIGITYFEALTALAILAFARRNVDLAVLEAGMGGRDDSTNVADPLVSIVTTVGLDHAEYLGGALESIAEHKAGVFRRDRPALIGWIDEPSRAVLERHASAIGARFLAAGELIEGPWSVARNAGQRVGLRTPATRYELETAMEGEHQARNLALAVLGAEALRGAGFARLDHDAIVRGTAAWRLAGRLEWLAAGGRRLLLDAAHNAAGAHALALYLRQLGTTVDLLFGAFADKDAGAMLDHLAPHVDGGVLTRPADAGRAWQPAAFVEQHPRWARMEVVPDDRAALAAALDRQSPRPLLICGSVRLVGDLRRRIVSSSSA